VAESLSRNTARAYINYWKQYVHWCEHRGVAPLPASPAVVFDFARECATGLWGNAPLRKGSIGVALAAIKHAQTRAGFCSSSFDAALEYQRTVEDPPVNARVATREDLDRFLCSFPNTLLSLRLKCVLTLIYEELLHVPELAALTSDDYMRSDEECFGGLYYPSALSRREKRWHPITDRSASALDAWVSAARITTGPIFCTVAPEPSRGRALSVAGLDRSIKAAQSSWCGPRLGVRALHRGHVVEASMPETERVMRYEQACRMGVASMAFRWRDEPSAMKRFLSHRRVSE
jgi:hypothetical protein